MSTVNAAAIMDRLGIDRESFRALGLLPLICIAWADGRLQLGERSFIRTFAKQKGWLTGRVEKILDGWLTTPPSDEDITDGITAFTALARERRGLGSSIPRDALDTIMLSCRDVAESSGGLFGLKAPICKEEDVALQRVADSLGLSMGRSWREVCEELESQVYDQSAPGSSGHFLFGKATEMLNDPLNLLLNSWRRFGDVVKIDVGPTFFHLIVHPEDIEHVFVNNSRNYVHHEIADEVKGVFGEGLVTSEGESRRKRRRALQPGFHMEKINGMVTVMTDICASFVKSFASAAETGQPVDIADEASKVALRILGQAMFHTETAGDAEVFKWALPVMVQHIANRNRSIIKIPGFVPTPGNLRLKEAVAALDKVVYRNIEARRSMKDNPDDMLSLMMAVHDDDTGGPITDEEVRNEFGLMLVAGHETTATALSWVFYYLSKHPIIARQVRAEVRRALDGRVPTAADLPKLALTSAMIEESIRLKPPFWLLGRKSVAEDRLSGHRIPAGSSVIISPYLTHRHPDFWRNPEGFDPERFLPEQSEGRHPMAFLPFGGGPRKCMGMAFAMMEMQIVVAMMISAYDLHLVPGLDARLNPTITLRALDGCWVTVHSV